MVDIAKVLGFYGPERRKNAESRKRVGRGRGSGLGKTCGKGGKGQSVRSGFSLVAGFEGGQTPLYRRMPRHGFNNYTRKSYKALSIDLVIYHIDKGNLTDNITISDLISLGLIKKYQMIKLLLGGGDINKPFSIEVNAASKTALEAMEKAGCSVTIIASIPAKSKASMPAELPVESKIESEFKVESKEVKVKSKKPEEVQEIIEETPVAPKKPRAKKIKDVE